MKKAIVIVCILITQFAIAQVSRGTVVSGGGLNYLQYSNDGLAGSSNDWRRFTTYVNPGFFVAHNFALGVLGGYENYFSHADYGTGLNNFTQWSETKTGLSSFGLFARAYKSLTDNKVFLFGQLQGVYKVGQATSTDQTFQSGILERRVTNTDITGLEIALTPGITYFITQRIGLECQVGNISYTSQRNTDSVGSQKGTVTKTNALALNFNLSSVLIGINFYLGGKKDI